MATRFYFPAAENSEIAPTISTTDWEHINGAVTPKRLRPSPDESGLTSLLYAPDGVDDLTDRDSNHRQYISDRLGAQTITGNVKAQFQGSEVANNCNLFLTLKLYVVDATGTSVTGTLLAITRDTTNEFTTSLLNRNFPSTAVGSVAANAGDRLVVEIGLGGNITSGAGGNIGHDGTLRWGCLATSGDLPENDTENGTTFRPWIEFTHDFAILDFPDQHMAIFRTRLQEW